MRATQKRKRAQKQHQEQKYLNRIRRVHYVYATHINPNWEYSSLLRGIVERLGNKHLDFIINAPGNNYKELTPYAVEELSERQLLGKERISENDDIISNTDIPPSFNSYDERYKAMRVKNRILYVQDGTNYIKTE